jgi:hypothetical protein
MKGTVNFHPYFYFSFFLYFSFHLPLFSSFVLFFLLMTTVIVFTFTPLFLCLFGDTVSLETIRRQVVEWLMNDKLERMWKLAVVT